MLTSSLTVDSPSSLQEALSIRADEPEAVVIAGGTDLMVALDGASPPSRMLNIWGLDELRGIKTYKKRVWIGALTNYTDLIRSPDLNEQAPALVEAAQTVGGRQIQNRGTIGGNIVNASPAGDTLPVLLALDAALELQSKARGSRFVPAERFFLGYKKLDLEPDELLTGIWLTNRDPNDWTHFRKLGTRAAQAISKVVMAGRLRITDGVVTEARVAFGSVAPVPTRCDHVESALTGKPVDPRASLELIRDITPIDDIRSTSSYRLRAATNILRAWLDSLR